MSYQSFLIKFIDLFLTETVLFFQILILDLFQRLSIDGNDISFVYWLRLNVQWKGSEKHFYLKKSFWILSLFALQPAFFFPFSFIAFLD